MLRTLAISKTSINLVLIMAYYDYIGNRNRNRGLLHIFVGIRKQCLQEFRIPLAGACLVQQRSGAQVDRKEDYDGQAAIGPHGDNVALP